MKLLSFWLFTLLFLINPIEKLEGRSVRRFAAPIQKVYVPQGFDDNDVVQFVVEGEFPNTCYSVGRAFVQLHVEQRAIIFYLEAFEQLGKCLPAKTHFTKVVDVGILPVGIYTIYPFKDLENSMGTIKVRRAKTPTIDNFPYAPVENM